MAKTKNNMQSSPKIGEFPHWSISPKALFTDITFLHDETDVKHIERYCLANGYIAFISYDEELSAWCWYELQQPLTETVWKKPVASKFEPPTSSPISELNLEKKIAKHLRKQGHNVKRQVRCEVGRADIVTDEAVYEVELTLTRAKLFEAIGQVLIYRQSINPDLKAIVIGCRSRENIEAIIENAKAIGVEVQTWDK